MSWNKGIKLVVEIRLKRLIWKIIIGNDYWEKID